jgi:hypothetical protein
MSDLTPQQQAALDEQIARIDQFEAFEQVWYHAQTPEVQAAYDRYVAEMHEATPHADGESDTRHKEGE